MPFPFGKSQKSPAEIVKNLKENMAYMEKLDATESKKCEKVSICLLLTLRCISGSKMTR
jgi:calcium binding protein 39